MASLTLTRRIAAQPDTVFDAISTPEGMAQWFGPDEGPVLLAESDLRVGGRFRVCFRMVDGSEHEFCGNYLEINRPTRLTMSWRWLTGEADGDPDSRIEIDLRPIESGTELTFTHALLTSDAARRAHEAGWNGSLDKLQRYLQHDEAK